MGQGYKQIFFKKRHTDGPKGYEETFDITNHQENEIKTTMRNCLTPVQMVVIDKK